VAIARRRLVEPRAEIRAYAAVGRVPLRGIEQHVVAVDGGHRVPLALDHHELTELLLDGCVCGGGPMALGFGPMRAYVLVEIGDSQAVDVFVRCEDAFEALEGAIKDEPDWAGTLSVVPIELDERDVSPN
jgi:hypothetical protein